MSSLFELRLAARTLRCAASSALIAAFALGLGIGLSTLIFSIVQGAMLRGQPLPEPHEIVLVERTNPARGGRYWGTMHDYAAWSESATSGGAVYRPLAQVPVRGLVIAARTRHPFDFPTPVREHINSLDPDLPLYGIGTLRSAVLEVNFRYGIFGGLFGSLGLAALVLASVGLYGVTSFSVGQRRREVGVRMAIGARSADVLRLILGRECVRWA